MQEDIAIQSVIRILIVVSITLTILTAVTTLVYFYTRRVKINSQFLFKRILKVLLILWICFVINTGFWYFLLGVSSEAFPIKQNTMKVELKEGVYIEGFDNINEWYSKAQYLAGVSEKDVTLVWSGEASDIPEDVVENVVQKTCYGNYKNYSGFLCFHSAKRSVISACNYRYCIIYKTE